MKKILLKKYIQKNYGSIAKSGTNSTSCCGSGCCCGSSPNNVLNSSIDIGYTNDDLKSAPNESNMGLGCGNPIAIAELKAGETVLDLGSGGGFDCFLARNKVGDKGFVIGIDMTEEMISLAKSNLEKKGYSNMEFRLGDIENMPIENSTIDVIISNCVINLSLNKKKIFKEAYRVLKENGRICISDVVATAKLPNEIKKDLTMYSGCVSGASHYLDIKEMLQDVGFKNIEMIPKDNSKQILNSWVPGRNIEDYVASYIIKATK